MSTPAVNDRLIYRGRFAPSPTGPLHFGSLIAATGSYLQARHQHGEWHLRIEDIDPPREIPGASDSILYTLEAYGFEWDGEVIYQSRRLNIYQEYLEQLVKDHETFACTCSRKDIQQQLRKSSSQVYPGTCRHKTAVTNKQYAYRIIAQDNIITFNDYLQGPQRYQLQTDIGDFVIKRADGLFSYQFAVAVDDGSMGITEVVRGSDLLASTPQQIYLQQRLNLKTPDYIHLPVATNALGQKLSKQTYAQALDSLRPVTLLWEILSVLGQAPLSDLKHGSLDELWQWAIANWDIDKIPRIPSFVVNQAAWTL